MTVIANLSNFIQKIVEISIMRAKIVVAEFMKHGIENLLIREEVPKTASPTPAAAFLAATAPLTPDSTAAPIKISTYVRAFIGISVSSTVRTLGSRRLLYSSQSSATGNPPSVTG